MPFMPTASPKPCSQCGTLVRDGSARCDAHKVAAWTHRPDAVTRTTGRRLQAQRAALFSREPLCRPCRKEGRVTEATIRDHIVSLEEGGADDDDNTQPICRICHGAKTARESARGRGGQMSAAPKVETDWVATFSRK
jgi:5-methylcytosine-specific restriction enzyme A